MLGILVALIVSWILLYLLERRSILSLGFLPILKRLKQFVLGFAITTVLCFGVQTLEMFLRSSQWNLNEQFRVSQLLNMFWWDFKSVLTEELIFRGALLFILIERLGAKNGILISAIAFGVYHWFSYGILGNIIPMIFVFIGTGLMGYAWALAFSKANSILLPFGLHLGWNFTFNSIFSNGPLGEGFITVTAGNAITDWFSIVGLWIVPIIVLLIVKFWIPSEIINHRDDESETKAKV